MTDELGNKTTYGGVSVASSAADGAPGEAPSAGVSGAVTEVSSGADELAIGAVLDDRYVVEAKLGEGGMGIVYRGRHRVIDKRVAIKMLRRNLSANSEMSERFLNEARAASRVGSPHIVDIADFGRLPDGGAYFVMEYLDGVSLSEVLRGGRMPAARIIHIGKQLAQGLAAAHAAGIVHRDLKPDNIMLVTRGMDRDVVKILDFGIAKVGDDSQRLTRAGSVFGTPHYMSPEQAAGVSVDKLSDVYALGVIFYEMASGSVPFDADSFMAILTQHMYKAPLSFRELPLPPSDILPGFEELVLKCMAKKPEDRYASMDELLTELERIERGERTMAAESGVDPATYALPADYYGGPSLAIPATPPPRDVPRELPATTTARASVVSDALDEVELPVARWNTRTARLAVGAIAVAVIAVVAVALRSGGSPPPSTTSASVDDVASVDGARSRGADRSAPPPSSPVGTSPALAIDGAPPPTASPPSSAGDPPPSPASPSSAPPAETSASKSSASRAAQETRAKPTPRPPTKPAATAGKPTQEAAPPPAPAPPARPQTRPPTCAIEDWDPFEHKCAR